MYVRAEPASPTPIDARLSHVPQWHMLCFVVVALYYILPLRATVVLKVRRSPTKYGASIHHAGDTIWTAMTAVLSHRGRRPRCSG